MTRALIAIAFVLTPCAADAQRRDDALDLARVCAHEAGWESGADCPAIAGVLRWRAERRGLSFRSMMHAYADGVFDRHREDDRRYFAHLGRRALLPLGWPGDARSWSRYRARWRALIRYAERVLAGDVEDPCHAGHWSSQTCGSCDRRMRAHGWERVTCVHPTRNVFWRPGSGG